jgi:WD40 repeat protein
MSDGNAWIGDRFLDLKKGSLFQMPSHNYPRSFSRNGSRVLWSGSLKPVRSKKDLAEFGNRQFILCSWPDCTDPSVFPREFLEPYHPRMMNQDGSRLLLWRPGSEQNAHAVVAMEASASPVPLRDYPTGDPGYWRADLSPILSPDGATVANGFVDGHTKMGLIYLWDAATGNKQKVLKSRGAVLMQSLAFSSDSQMLAAAITAVEMKYEGGMGHWLLGYDYIRSFNRTRVEVWSMKTKRRIRTIENIGAWVQALAFSPDGRELLIGGQDGLVHRLDLDSGDFLATYATLSPVSAVAVSPDGRHMLVSGYGESYWDLASGTQLYTVLASIGAVLPGEKPEHLTWTPNGYYQGSDRLARNFVHLVNDLETYTIDQFFEQFYNPAMIEAQVAGLQTDALNITAILDLSPPPQVEMQTPKVNAKGTATVEVLARDTGGGVREVRFFHNGKRIGDGTWSAVKSIQLASDGKGIRDRGLTRIDGPAEKTRRSVTALDTPVDRGDVRTTFKIRLLPGENTFRVVAFSGEMIESKPVEAVVEHKGKDSRGVLRIIAVGICEYRSPLNRLPAARDDAESFVQQITQTAPKLFGNFKAFTLYDVKASRAEILTTLKKVERDATAADTLVFYFAGHGMVVDSDGRFYLMAQGVSALDGDSPGSVTREGISDLELGSALQRIAALRQVVFLDACQSGGADFSGSFQKAGEEVAIKRVGRASGTWIFSAAGKAEYAYETPELGHGLFTHALLAGLGGEADAVKDDRGIYLSELKKFVYQKVTEYARKLKIKQHPIIQQGFNDFPISRN